MNELPQGWASVLAGDLCEVVGGATPRTDTPEYWGGGIPWLTPDDLSRDRSQYIAAGRRSLTPAGLASCAATMVPKGAVLFTSRAPIGYAAIATREVATNQGFKSLVPSASLTSEFLYWQLRHLTEQIRSMGSGTTFAEVSKKVMAAVPLVVAPIREQLRIVTAIEEAFSKLDAGEAGLRTVRQLLKRMREAVLAAAVTGRLVPQDPTDIPATNILADLGIVSAMGDGLPNAWAQARPRRRRAVGIRHDPAACEHCVLAGRNGPVGHQRADHQRDNPRGPRVRHASRRQRDVASTLASWDAAGQRCTAKGRLEVDAPSWLLRRPVTKRVRPSFVTMDSRAARTSSASSSMPTTPPIEHSHLVVYSRTSTLV